MQFIAENVRNVRVEMGLTQEQLAERAGLSSRSISRVENGQSTPHPSSLERIAQVLGVGVEDLSKGPPGDEPLSRWETIPVARLSTGHDLLALLAGRFATWFGDDEIGDDASLDLLTGFEKEVLELGDVLGDLDPIRRRGVGQYVGERLDALDLADIRIYGSAQDLEVSAGRVERIAYLLASHREIATLVRDRRLPVQMV